MGRKYMNHFVELVLCIVPLLSFSQENNLEQPYFISSRTGERHVSLSNDWQLTHSEESITNTSDLDNKEYLKVTEPTSVQMAYYKDGKLPNPYEHMNSEEYLWIEKQIWYYQKDFTPFANQRQKYAFMTFEGLDYFLRIWLNGNLLGSHKGMFGGPSLEVSDYLKYGEPNRLIVEVKSGNYNQWEEKVIEEIFMPGQNPTNCAFDHADKLGLVVTEAEKGLLLSVDLDSKEIQLYNGINN